MFNPIAISANGIPMYIHPESHSHRPDLNAEVIGKIVLPEDNTFYRNTIDLSRVIGKDHLVETDEHDTIVYLQRGNRPGKSRMVLKEADDTSFVTIIACIAHEEEGTPAELVGKWILVTLFEGKQGQREPFDRSFADGKNPEGLKRSEEFWATHALVPTSEELKILKESKFDYTVYYSCGEFHTVSFDQWQGDHEGETFDEMIKEIKNAKQNEYFDEITDIYAY